MIKYFKQKGGRIYRKVDFSLNKKKEKIYILLAQIMSSVDETTNTISEFKLEDKIFAKDIRLEYVEVDEKEYNDFKIYVEKLLNT